MSIVVERLASLEAFVACERLQQAAKGIAAPIPFLTHGVLAAIDKSGGLILGAYDTAPSPRRLCGCVVDLLARCNGYPSRLTLLHCVAREMRNRGVGYRLRLNERTISRQEGVELITWAMDPMRSEEAHFGFNKLGAVAVDCNSHGPFERLRRALTVEWWVNSPRVSSVIERRQLPHHFLLGLDEMEVATKTGVTKAGVRRMIDVVHDVQNRTVLVEIPAALDQASAVAPHSVEEWRAKIEALFEELFAAGYILSGFVHEGGRSFHFLEREDKGNVLGRTP